MVSVSHFPIIISCNTLLGLMSSLMFSECRAMAVFRPTPWALAHATFYDDETASSTFGGAFGYGNLTVNGYGTNTAALSTTLFSNGYTSGTCYQIKCYGTKAYNAGVPYITITATNLCPLNWAEASYNGGWCNPPRTYFDLSEPAFLQIAQYKARIIPVMYRRVPCMKAKASGSRSRGTDTGYWRT